MKKTLALMSVIATGCVFADDAALGGIISQWSGSVTTTSTVVNFSTEGVNTFGASSNGGFTVVIKTVNWNPNQNGPLFYLTTNASPAYSQYSVSALAVGMVSQRRASLFNLSGSSSTVTNAPAGADYTALKTAGVASFVDAGTVSAGNYITTTWVATVTSGGAVNLYETDATNTLHLIATLAGTDSNNTMKTEDVTGIVLGGWASSNASTADNLSLTVYSGVATEEQAQKLVPEPATATLSLLALAGLCARRRRK